MCKTDLLENLKSAFEKRACITYIDLMRDSGLNPVDPIIRDQSFSVFHN